MQDWFANNIKKIHNDIKFKVIIIFDSKAKAIKQITMPLACITIFCQMAEYLDIYFVFDLIESNFKKISQ